jgi:hypothetical protein
MDWETFITKYEGVLDIKDRQAISIIIAFYMSLETQGDPPWLLWIAPPSTGKTETMGSFRGHENCLFITDLTEKALVSHFRKKDGKDPSLLRRMINKVNIIPDFSPIMSFHPVVRNKIFSMLRAAFDKNTDFFSGVDKPSSYVGKFVIIAGATPIIDKYRSMETSLGERFLTLRTSMDKRYRKASARASMDNSPRKTDMRREMKEILHEFIDGATIYENVSDEDKDKIADVADLLAYARGNVPRNGYTKHITDEPTTESPTRAADQLLQVYSGVANLVGQDEGHRALHRLVRDSIPPLRSRALQYIVKYGKAGMTNFGYLKVHEHTMKYVLEDLEMLEILRNSKVRIGSKTEKIYTLTDEFEGITKEVFTSEPIVVRGPKTIVRQAVTSEL